MEFLLFGSALTNSSIGFINKKLITRGMTAKEYFYYVTLALVPFSALFFFIYPFQIAFSFTAFLLLIASVGVRALNSLSLLQSLKTVTPLTISVYSTMAILISYFIDVFIGAVSFEIFQLLAIVIVVIGTVIIALKNITVLKQVKLPVIMRVFSEMLKGYLGYFILKHMNVSTYIFLMAVITTLIMLPITKQMIAKFNTQKMKYATLSQAVGVISLILSNLLAKSSATLFMLNVPATLIITLLLSYVIKKDVGSKPTLLELIGSVVVVAGLTLFSILSI